MLEWNRDLVPGLPEDFAMDKGNLLMFGLTAAALGISIYILRGPKLGRRSQSPSEKKGYLQVAGRLPPQHFKEKVSACSLSDDESDSSGAEKNQDEADLCEFTSHVSSHLSASISPDSANPLPSEPFLTDDEDIDDHLIVNNRSLLEGSLTGKLHEVSISTSLRRGSISELSSEESVESDDESCENGDVKEEGQCVAETLENREPPAVGHKPPIRAFYIPRENIIPDTRDASLKSTAYERIKRVNKSKIFSNVLTDDTIWRVKSVEKVWRSINNLSDTTHWQKLLTFGEPVLMNFKLIELKSSFKTIIKSTSDFTSCCTIFEVLGEITRSKFEAHKAELFKELATPQFIHNLHSIIEKCHKTRPRHALLNRFIENFVDIYGDIFLQLDSLTSDDLASDLEGLIRSCLLLIESGDDQRSADQLQQLLMILESRATLIRANSSFPFNVLKEESVESNIIDGPFDSVDQYLTVHYRLMKEDFQNSLRAGVIDHIKTAHGLKRKTINYHLNVFTNVTLTSHLTAFSVKYKIIFYDPIVLDRLRDPASPNFLTGSLLMLTNTQFQDYSLVRVEDRSPLEREQNHIFVSMVLGTPGLPRMMHFAEMAEPSRLFEPYYRVLNVLRTIDSHQFPFMRYIVDVETDVFPPAFMKPDTKLKIDDYFCNLWENDTWPAPEKVGLNPVQLEGLKQALRNELAIIQGPPGTGKTYLSKKIIEVLIQNKTIWHKNDDDGAGLIMVVCFKNQSLDQLLTGLIRDKVKVLRIGTQSKEEMLDAYNLKTLDDPKFSQIYNKMRWRLAKEQKGVINNLKDSLEIVDEITAHSGIIKLKYFSYLLRLSARNLNYLKGNYEKWLLEIPCNEPEPDFRTLKNVLGEQTWAGNSDYLKEQSKVYQTTLQDVMYLSERVNAKLDILKELGSSDFVDLLTSAAMFLVQKQKFMEDRFYALKSATTDVELLDLYNFKKEFEVEDQYPLEKLLVDQRWLLYKAWMHDLYQHHYRLIESIVAESTANSQRYVEIEELLNMRKISQCDAEVVGLTTTAAAKYFKMMDCLKPKIVLVEEAAEVMEAHTVASLSKFCEHLILVGDHKQLRPLTSSHIIGKEAHLDYSLYERLVKNGFQPCTLNTQYRMRPDIADLIRPAVYKELLDDPSVNEYPQVLGVNAYLYFVDHTVNEDLTPEIVSRWNKHEAEFHLAFCNYLVLQGYQPSQITILATYSEQEKYFNREKLKYPQLDEVLMATVDSFQGKENDIILLSLVRSNAEAIIGFLAQENRINVALSRAKVGLFITGNKSNLLARDGLWTRVVGVLQKKKAIGKKLPLKCQIHQKISLVADAREIKSLRNGGCTKQCKASLRCGHKCIHLCHPLDREHEVHYKCLTPCNMLMDCSHQCTLKCHSTNPLVFKCFCRSCSPISRCGAPLPCGHMCQSLGHDEDIEHKSTHQCQVTCNTLAPCGHICVSLCHVEDKNHQAAYKCVIKCEGVLICGHPCDVDSTKKKQHGCLKHKPCLHCRNLTSKSTKTGDVEIQTVSPTKTELNMGRSSAADSTVPYHKCKRRKYARTCVLKCGALLSCLHLCCKDCHSRIPHTVQDKCESCSKTDDVLEKLRELRIDHPKGQPFVVHCEHNASIEQCSKLCNGMLCGHDCSDLTHICSSHYRIGCQKKCPVKLSCRHKCTRRCHLGDDNHFCSKRKCANAVSGSSNRAGALEIQPEEHIDVEVQEQVENLSPGQPAKIIETHVRRGHQCKLVEGVCKRLCKTILYCGHPCRLKCNLHEDGPNHLVSEKCSVCSRSGVRSSQGSHPLNPKKPPEEPIDIEVQEQVENLSPGQPAKIIETHVRRGHQCKLVEGVCKRLCKTILYCGHPCRLRCNLHEDGPNHLVTEKCSVCSRSGVRSSQGSHPLNPKKDPEKPPEEPIDIEVQEQVENLSPGQPAQIIETHVRRGHQCKLVEGVCKRLCNTILYCGHPCRLRCNLHEDGPNHLVTEKCSVCSRSGVRSSQGSHPLNPKKYPEKPPEEPIDIEVQEQVENLSPGQPAKIIETHVRRGHQCKLVGGVCKRLCKTILYCGHPCRLRCNLHEDGPNHLATEKCSSCSSSGVRSSQGSHPLNPKTPPEEPIDIEVQEQVENLSPGQPAKII